MKFVRFAWQAPIVTGPDWVDRVEEANSARLHGCTGHSCGREFSAPARLILRRRERVAARAP